MPNWLKLILTTCGDSSQPDIRISSQKCLHTINTTPEPKPIKSIKEEPSLKPVTMLKTITTSKQEENSPKPVSAVTKPSKPLAPQLILKKSNEVDSLIKSLYQAFNDNNQPRINSLVLQMSRFPVSIELLNETKGVKRIKSLSKQCGNEKRQKQLIEMLEKWKETCKNAEKKKLTFAEKFPNLVKDHRKNEATTLSDNFKPTKRPSSLPVSNISKSTGLTKSKPSSKPIPSSSSTTTTNNTNINNKKPITQHKMTSQSSNQMTKPSSSSRPMPRARPKRVVTADDLFRDDEDDDFIVDDTNHKNSKVLLEVRKMLHPGEYRDIELSDDDHRMEATTDQIEAEERFSRQMANKEDAEELKKIQEEERREREMKMKQKYNNKDDDSMGSISD
ncbi:hypothetical protein WA158_006018 [Blastocystis sp. Blastoise]